MGLVEITSEIKELLDAVGVPVSLGLRTAGDQTPSIVFDVTNADAAMVVQGVVKQVWNVTAQVDCIADKALDAASVADSVIAEFTGPMNTGDYTLVLVGAAAASRTETPDDGQQDAERILSLTLTIIAREN
ncbi:MAG: hypothetical protein ACOYM9_21435 [Bradymonadia bacterium]